MFFAIMMAISMLFAGIILDIGLTSIYAYFGWEFWPTFVVIGALIGLIKGMQDECWRIPTILVYGFCGYVVAEQWMIDGIVYAIIIACIYGAIQRRFTDI